MQIEIGFDAWKALTALRESEAHTYDDVLRKLLGIEQAPARSNETTENGFALIARRRLPNGTALRAVYKGRSYSGEIRENRLIGHDGRPYPSASSAAAAITGNNVNGLTFWEAKRPGDQVWVKIANLSKERA